MFARPQLAVARSPAETSVNAAGFHSTSPDSDEWRADLALRFAHREGRTVLAERRHKGPLTIQKALYPEGPDICHAVIIHPPGGIAGGDRLHLTVEVESGSRAVVTTPAATKWYKSGGKISGQEIGIRLGSRSTLDWLPQENLFFNGTRARSKFRLEIDPTASAVGWDMMMLGRRASGEQWEKGEIYTLMEIRRPDHTPLWIERLALQGGDILLESPQGLAGYPAAGTLWAVGNACTRSLASELNACLPFESRLRAGATVLPGGILLLRCLATEIEKMRTLMADYWMKLRPIVLGAVSHPLRLWAT